MNTTIKNTTKYKNSPLGLIPEDWDCFTVQELVNSGVIEKPLDGNHGNIHPTSNDFVDEGIPFVMANNIQNGKVNLIDCYFIRKEQADKLQKGFSVEGDVLITHKGTVGNVAIVNNIKTDYIMLTPQVTYYRINNFEILDRQYLKSYFESESFRSVLKVKSGGGTRAYIGITNQRKLQIVLPNINEQKAIANCLSTWDKAIEKQNGLIAQKELSKKALMQQLLSGKKRLKGFSDKWDLKSLEEVATFKNGKAHENGIDEDGAFKVVNSKFVSTNGTVFKSTNDNLCPLFVNDIAMVMSDIPNGKALAKCFYVDENNKYTLNQRICSITANKDTNSKFLFFILNRNIYYLSFDNGVGQTNLKKEEVLECPLLMPDFREQTAIANVLQCADEELQLLKEKLEQLKEQKKGLMQVLLTGKKRLKY